jgi:diguanylate cyclase (GGDEF)-like protein/PAS domain S-box-containing protein
MGIYVGQSSSDNRRGRCRPPPPATLLATACATVLTIRGLGALSRSLYLLPATAIVLGLLLPHWHDVPLRRLCQAAGALGVFFGAIASSLPILSSLAIALVSLADVAIIGAILSPRIAGFEDIKQRNNLKRFVLGCLVGPAVATLLAIVPVVALAHPRPLHFLASVFLADALGLAVILPLLLFLFTGHYCSVRKLAPHLRRGGTAALIFAAMLCFIFWQTSYPILFAAFPPMVLVLVATGLEGGVLIATLTAVIGFWATASGHGPMHLMTGGSADRSLMLQLFVLLISATALPLGALWDDRQRAERKAAEAGNIYQTLLQHADQMIILSSIDGSRRYASPACAKLTGYSPDEFIALERVKTIHPDDRPIARMVIDSMVAGKQNHTLRYRIAQKSGGWRWVEFSMTAYLDQASGAVAGYVGTVRDVTAVQITEQERDDFARERENFLQEARTDALTGLPNRRAFDEALDRQIYASLGARQDASLLLIDVDFFKKYNDAFGHQDGDRCLCEIGVALRRALGRESDFVARWGGEEFVVLLPGTNERGALTVAHTLMQAVRALRLDHPQSPLGIVTVGIAELDAEVIADPRVWIQKADMALYESKRSGRNQARIHIATAHPRPANAITAAVVQFPDGAPVNPNEAVSA